MRRKVIIAGILLLLTSGGGFAFADDPVLLATYEFWTNGGGAPQSDSCVELTLQLTPQHPPVEYRGLGSDLGLFWEDGDQGSFDYDANNDSEFNEFATLASNGIDDVVILSTMFPNGGGKGNIGTESELFGAAPDLVGFDLEMVRLIVEEVQIDPWIPDPVNYPQLTGFKYNVFGKYEFYGHIVPEPCSLAVQILGFLLLFWRS